MNPKILSPVRGTVVRRSGSLVFRLIESGEPKDFHIHTLDRDNVQEGQDYQAVLFWYRQPQDGDQGYVYPKMIYPISKLNTKEAALQTVLESLQKRKIQ